MDVILNVFMRKLVAFQLQFEHILEMWYNLIRLITFCVHYQFNSILLMRRMHKMWPVGEAKKKNKNIYFVTTGRLVRKFMASLNLKIIFFLQWCEIHIVVNKVTDQFVFPKLNNSFILTALKELY